MGNLAVYGPLDLVHDHRIVFPDVLVDDPGQFAALELLLGRCAVEIAQFEGYQFLRLQKCRQSLLSCRYKGFPPDH